jgi:hypothetical protein
MGIKDRVSRARHSLGFHTGEWAYDTPGNCAQTRVCTGCGDVAKRVEHSYGEWFRNERVAEESDCGLLRTCAVCNDAHLKPEHEIAWYYFSDLPSVPDFPKKAYLSGKYGLLSNPCKQYARCKHCTHVEQNFRVWHDFGDRELGGAEHTQINETTSYNTGLYYYECRKCHKRESGGTGEI